MKTYEPQGSMSDRRTEEIYGLLERMKGMNFQGKVNFLPDFFRELDKILDQRLNIIKSALQKEFLKIAEAVNDGAVNSLILNQETFISLTLDSSWRTYTFSSEVPSDAKFVILSFLGSTSAGNTGRLAWGNYGHTFKVVDWRIGGASGSQNGGQAIVPLDGSLRADYYGITDTGITINCRVAGYIT